VRTAFFGTQSTVNTKTISGLEFDVFRNLGAVPAVVQDAFFSVFEIRYQMRQIWKKIRHKKT
jgi:hypothetical protein